MEDQLALPSVGLQNELDFNPIRAIPLANHLFIIP
jgi:hypothetical protein